MILQPGQSVDALRQNYSADHSPANAPTNVPPNGATTVASLSNSPSAVTWD